jgi:hypothetical protein
MIRSQERFGPTRQGFTRPSIKRQQSCGWDDIEIKPPPMRLSAAGSVERLSPRAAYPVCDRPRLPFEKRYVRLWNLYRQADSALVGIARVFRQDSAVRRVPRSM